MIPQGSDDSDVMSDGSNDMDSEHDVPDPPRRSERKRTRSKKYDQQIWELNYSDSD